PPPRPAWRSARPRPPASRPDRAPPAGHAYVQERSSGLPRQVSLLPTIGGGRKGGNPAPSFNPEGVSWPLLAVLCGRLAVSRPGGGEAAAEADGGAGCGEAGAVVRLDHHAAQGRLAVGRGEALAGHLSDKAGDGWALLHA